MEKFIPYEKLSKNEKRKLDRAKRKTWGELNPVTRKPADSKAYNRSKTRNWKRTTNTFNSEHFDIKNNLGVSISFDQGGDGRPSVTAL